MSTLQYPLSGPYICHYDVMSHAICSSFTMQKPLMVSHRIISQWLGILNGKYSSIHCSVIPTQLQLWTCYEKKGVAQQYLFVRQSKGPRWFWGSVQQNPGFPKAKALKTLFGPIKPTNPSAWMAYKGQSSFGIIAVLYTYQACKTLFRPIKPTNLSVQI